jgi:hypothetical protein
MAQLTTEELRELPDKWLADTITCEEIKILDEWNNVVGY